MDCVCGNIEQEIYLGRCGGYDDGGQGEFLVHVEGGLVYYIAMFEGGVGFTFVLLSAYGYTQHTTHTQKRYLSRKIMMLTDFRII